MLSFSKMLQGFPFVFVILLLTCFSECHGNEPPSESESLVYTATFKSYADDPLIYEWTFERSISSEVLFFWPDIHDENHDESDGSLLTVSGRRLNDAEFQASFNAWQTMRQNFTYLRLSCAATETRSSDECICTKYIRSGNSSLRSTPAETTNSSDWIKSSIVQCPSLPRLTSTVFRDFKNVVVLEFDGVRFGGVDAVAFHDLHSLLLLRISHFSMTVLGRFADGIWCELPNFAVLQLYHYVSGTDALQAVLPLLRCKNETNTNVSVQRSRVKLIDIQNVAMIKISNDVFQSISVELLFVVTLRNNSIGEIENEAFSRFSAVVEMDISENQLTFLENFVFKDFHNLEYLNLASNQLDSIETATFENLHKLLVLNINGNRITHIEGSFNILPNLLLLDLGSNRLPFISENTFSNCTILHKLWLDRNRITKVHANAFVGSTKLWDLDMSGNRLSNESIIRDFLQYKVEGLKQLHLGRNNISRLIPSMFAQRGSTFKLQAIYLESNSIEYIDQEAFTYHPSLLVVRLGNNKLTSLHPATFRKTPKLVILSLPNNCLESLPFLPNSIHILDLSGNRVKQSSINDNILMNLEELNLHGNEIIYLDGYSLRLMPALKKLNVSNCGLVNISDEAFLRCAKLEELDLSQNDLDINFTINYAQNCEHFKKLNVSRNRIQSSVNLLVNNFRFAHTIDISHNPLVTLPVKTSGTNPIFTEKLFMTNCSLERVSDSVLETATMIGLIDLTSNRLREFQPFRLPSLATGVHYLVLLRDNPIQCSCRMSWLMDEQYNSHYIVPFCYRARTGALERFNSIPREEFLCRVSESCTVELPQCECYTEDNRKGPTHLDCSYKLYATFPRNIEQSFKIIHFEGNGLTSFKKEFVSMTLNTLEKLYLMSNEIAELEPFAFVKFPNLQLLDLSENRLVIIRDETFSHLKQLKWLHLSNNLISFIDGSVFANLRLLNALMLHNNSLPLLTTDNMDDIESLVHLSNLTLFNNPWSCPCDNATFKNWIQLHSETISDISKILCNDTSSIVTIPDENLLCYDLNTHIVDSQYFIELVTFSSSFCVLLTMTFLLLYRFRFVLQVLFYATFGLRRSRKENQMCRYDAFTVYDSSDILVRQWIQNVFLFHVEPNFKCFIPDRDMLLGTDKNSEFVKNIKLSRRTIIVLSADALQSQEILFAIEIAFHCVRLENCHHQLLFILLEGVDRKDLMARPEFHSSLRTYLKSDACISVRDKLFWQKLNYFLPSPRLSSELHDERPSSGQENICFALQSLET